MVYDARLDPRPVQTVSKNQDDVHTPKNLRETSEEGLTSDPSQFFERKSLPFTAMDQGLSNHTLSKEQLHSMHDVANMNQKTG